MALTIVAAGIPAYREAVNLIRDLLWPGGGSAERAR